LVQDLEEAYSDPVLEPVGLDPAEARNLVADHPDAARTIVRLHRAYQDATSSADAYADRLRADPLLSELLHQILTGITGVRSGTEILADVPDLDEAERARFLKSISRDSIGLAEVARSLIGHFERSSRDARTMSPQRQLDDLIITRNNHFPELEAAGAALRAEVEALGPFEEATLTSLLAERFGVRVERGGAEGADAARYPRAYGYDPGTRVMWFRKTAPAATRQFQLLRLLGELAAPDALAAASDPALLATPAARSLGHRALGSYLAGAALFPYERFLEDAEVLRYDIDVLCDRYQASYEQVAHRLVSLRRPDAEGVPFGFLRSDPAGRLTKHFPLPGLLLPNSGHACPLWAIYSAFGRPGEIVRQTVRFSDGSRYLFIARTQGRRPSRYREPGMATSVMLACNLFHADRTVYGTGLDLGDPGLDVPVGPSCRLCVRHDCISRQEEAVTPSAV
jgi:predicted transcriptional regulator